ncbi:hypothetical protein [Amycolatopsis sp. YIM 10]|uniref:hypothetical protein n=1 Tax=Amycolatopsis sp. YIM 10 TaxID=2653857 RepID=UPI00128FF691|nr:hypothetical protein [Amycolatopsis sp. YIM 10]
MTHESMEVPLPKLNLADLKPYLSVILLECAAEDPEVAFDALRRFLRRTALDPGRADEARLLAEVALRPGDLDEDIGAVEGLGVEHVVGIAREVRRVPSWAERDAGFADVLNQLSVAVRRNRLVAVYSTITTDNRISHWIRQEAAPFRLVPAVRLADTFRGDGKMLWLRGVHRPRRTKPDSKALGGMRVQETLNSIEDGTYALSAAKVAYLPEDENALLRDLITVSPANSRVWWKRTSHFAMFLAAVSEVLDTVEKALSAGEDPAPQFSELAVPETELDRVRGAFEVMVRDPEHVHGDPVAADDRDEQAEFVRSAIIAVRGDAASAQAFVDVGRQGAVAGTLVLKPVKNGERVQLDVRYSGEPSAEALAREVKAAIAEEDLVTVYYESGHLFDNGQVVRQNLASSPFPNLLFEDFSGFAIMKEKPNARGDQAIHNAIATNGDDSLFAWVVRRFSTGWLLCDDGAGEIADFLHLTDDGTLTAIHVKAAHHAGPGRRIAVTPFEQVVSQAEKNIRLLDTDLLVDRLSTPRIQAPAAWYAGNRITSAEFVHQLRARVATDRTKVTIVQPHLLRTSYEKARAALGNGESARSRDACALILLDNVLHSTRRTVTALWDDLFVIGCE